MKIGLCSYIGYKIYPGRGKTMVKADGKVFTFVNKKCESAQLMHRNPRKVTWIVLYRRKHKKGQEEEQTKKRTRRTQKFQRAFIGASLPDILAKRNMKPEVRKAQRELLRLPRNRSKLLRLPVARTKAVPKQKAVKVQQKSAPRVCGKR